jgi:alpha-tubulin suppressor-like RCC1 family protein
MDLTGSAYGIGNNRSGLLGVESRTLHSSPVPIGTDQETFTYAACTQFDTAFVTGSGRIVIYSEKTDGPPIIVNLDHPVVYVAGSYAELVAIDNSGAVYQFLFDSQEPPIRHQMHKPVYDAARGDGFIIVVATDGSTFGNGILNEGSDDFARIPSLRGEKVLRVYAYHNHAGVITYDYRALTWGQNDKGQLGRGKKASSADFADVVGIDGQPIRSMALGYEFSLFLTWKGQVFGCGRNKYGQLFTTPSKPVRAPTRASLLPEGVTAIFAGDKFSIAHVEGQLAAHPGMYAFGVEPPVKLSEGRQKAFFREIGRKGRSSASWAK